MDSGYKLILKRNDPIKFWSAFKRITQEYKYISARFDPDLIEYYFLRAQDEDFEIEDYSCIFIFNDIPFFAFLGALFSRDDKKTLNLFEMPCLAIDSLSVTQSQKKKINEFLFKLLSLDFDIFTIKGPDYNIKLPLICELLLLVPESIINVEMSKTIDLEKNESELKRNIRKSYHSLINWGIRELSIEIHDNSNIKWNTMEKFRRLHIEAAKRETRSIRTWEKQYEAIKDGSSFCVTATSNLGLVSAAFFILSYNSCYYGSSASNRSLFDKPLNHCIIWKAILESKRKGALLFDIGSTYLDESKIKSTKKEKNIAYFKEGFGGKQTLNYFIEYQKK